MKYLIIYYTQNCINNTYSHHTYIINTKDINAKDIYEALKKWQKTMKYEVLQITKIG